MIHLYNTQVKEIKQNKRVRKTDIGKDSRLLVSQMKRKSVSVSKLMAQQATNILLIVVSMTTQKKKY